MKLFLKLDTVEDNVFKIIGHRRNKFKRVYWVVNIKKILRLQQPKKWIFFYIMKFLLVSRNGSYNAEFS